MPDGWLVTVSLEADEARAGSELHRVLRHHGGEVVADHVVRFLAPAEASAAEATVLALRSLGDTLDHFNLRVTATAAEVTGAVPSPVPAAGLLRLGGVAEIAEFLGVSRQRASTLARSEEFPEPLCTPASGPMWLWAEVERFALRWRREPGREPVITAWRLGDLVDKGMLSEQLADFLAAAMTAGLTVAISGRRGSGKSTLLRALIQEIPEGERCLVLAEDGIGLTTSTVACELCSPVSALRRPAADDNADRIIYDTADESAPGKALIGRYGGSLMAITASSAEGALALLASRCDKSPDRGSVVVSNSFDLVVHVAQPNKRSARRMVAEVVAVDGASGARVNARPLWIMSPAGHVEPFRLASDPLVDKLRPAGFDPPATSAQDLRGLVDWQDAESSVSALLHRLCDPSAGDRSRLVLSHALYVSVLCPAPVARGLGWADGRPDVLRLAYWLLGGEKGCHRAQLAYRLLADAMPDSGPLLANWKALHTWLGTDEGDSMRHSMESPRNTLAAILGGQGVAAA